MISRIAPVAAINTATNTSDHGFFIGFLSFLVQFQIWPWHRPRPYAIGPPKQDHQAKSAVYDEVQTREHQDSDLTDQHRYHLLSSRKADERREARSFISPPNKNH
jgi:hypothetical protein